MGCVHNSPKWDSGFKTPTSAHPVGNFLELRTCQLAVWTPFRPPVPFSSGQKPLQTYIGGGRGWAVFVAVAACLQSLELSRTPVGLSGVVGICIFASG